MYAGFDGDRETACTFNAVISIYSVVTQAIKLYTSSFSYINIFEKTFAVYINCWPHITHSDIPIYGNKVTCMHAPTHMHTHTIHTPTSVGRLCELDETPEALASRTSCQNLTDYQDRLIETSRCSQGQPGQLTWTPDADTPNLVYYQVSIVHVSCVIVNTRLLPTVNFCSISSCL